MTSRQRLGNSLILSGLLIAIFLGFETFEGMPIKLFAPPLFAFDSTYLIAIADAAILFIGVTLRSEKPTDDYAKIHSVERLSLLGAGIALLILVFSGFMLLSAIPVIPWSDVYWFDPPLNFALIRNSFRISLFVSLLLVLWLVFIVSRQSFEQEMADQEENRDKEKRVQ